LLYIVDCVCLSLMSRSPSPPVLERQRSPSPPVLPRQLPLPLFASGQLVEGSFGDRSKENVGPSARPVKPKDAAPMENVHLLAHRVTPKDPSPLEDRGPDKKKTRMSEEGAIGRTPTSGAEGGGRSDETPTSGAEGGGRLDETPTSGAEGGGRSDETPTRMLRTGRRVLTKLVYKTSNDARASPPVGLVPPPPLKERQLLVGRASERPMSDVSYYLHRAVFSVILT